MLTGMPELRFRRARDCLRAHPRLPQSRLNSTQSGPMRLQSVSNPTSNHRPGPSSPYPRRGFRQRPSLAHVTLDRAPCFARQRDRQINFPPLRTKRSRARNATDERPAADPVDAGFQRLRYTGEPAITRRGSGVSRGPGRSILTGTISLPSDISHRSSQPGAVPHLSTDLSAATPLAAGFADLTCLSSPASRDRPQ